MTIFVSAFLLFQVQPLISKYILPWFGGSPAVWTTCMLFFQVLLFAGYAYAHFTTRRFSPRTQAVLHCLLILAALLFLPVTPDSSWKPTGNEQPAFQIVMLLAVSVGLLFFLLSSTGPLLQHWFSRTHSETSPYRLYALSNFGSLLALISYPFVFEPALVTRLQAELWPWAFLAFALICTTCAVMMGRSCGSASVADQPDANSSFDTAAAPTLGVRLLWFGLAMAASVMLLATTNQVCLDVALIPFLWVLPLTLYLISFILCFDSDRWYSRRLFAQAMAVSAVTICVVMLKGAGVSIVTQALVYFGALFFCAMVCHGELVRLKPDPRFLTSFYLIIAAGGAAGGLFVGIVAPAIFPAYLELHFGILACCLLTLVVFFRERNWVFYRGKPRWAWSGMILGVMALAVVLRVQAGETIDDALAVSRNFYGVLRVTDERADDPQRHQLKLMHGRIVHGRQFVTAEKRLEPTAYYGRRSGVGLVLESESAKPRRVGAVGLGVGTVAAYARPGDTYRFYEINPDVIRLAEDYFSYLGDCRGNVDIVLGDARLSLEQSKSKQFDVLVLDAFSGDAIPAHLLTMEAFEIYLQHLTRDGVLAVHISNLHFDLRPVVTSLAEQFDLSSMTILSPKDEEKGTDRCMWFLASRERANLPSHHVEKTTLPAEERRILWTDDRSNLFEILR